MMIAKSVKPIELTAGGFFAISLSSFSAVSRRIHMNNGDICILLLIVFYCSTDIDQILFVYCTAEASVLRG